MNEQQAISIVRKLVEKFASNTVYINVLNVPNIFNPPEVLESAIFVGTSANDDDMVIIMEAGSMIDYEEEERSTQNVAEDNTFIN